MTAYRKRDLPVHIINADVLQERAAQRGARLFRGRKHERRGRRHRLKDPLRRQERREAPETTAANVSSDEQLDDYTGPADAKSVSHDLRATMHELTLRMLATGVSTVVLLLASFIAEAGFSPNNTDVSGAIRYTVVSLIF